MTEEKISPFQLICLLLAGRLYTLLIWAPAGAEPGSMLAAALLSPLLQWGGVLCAMGLWDWLRGRGGRLRQIGNRLAQGLGLLLALGVAAWAAYSCGRFVADAFYQHRFTWVAVLLLLGAGALGAFQGVEAFSRAALPVVVLAGAGLLLLGVGAVGSMRLAYLPPLTLTAAGTAQYALRGVLMNFELAALLFFQPYSTKRLKKRAIAAWLGIVGLLSVAMMLTVMLTLGYYGQGQAYPMLAVARCARLSLLERPDPVLMGIWVVLCLLKVTLFLFMAAKLWRQLFVKRLWAWHPRWSRTAAGALLVVLSLTLSGCAGKSGGIGSKTLVTMLELEPGERWTVRAEYRHVGRDGGEAQARYGVYTAQGDTPAEAVEELERKESVQLFLESCRVVAFPAQTSPETTMALLEELDGALELRPLTAIFLTQDSLLAGEWVPERTMGRALEQLFMENGGQLAPRYTLKDSLACGRDPRLSLLLPLIALNERGDGVVLRGLR